METTTKNDNGSPDPSVQGKDGETASNSSEPHVKKIASLIDAETQQAAMGIRGAAAAIQDTIFADREPFDPAKFTRDLVGS